jgi:hypothetical protein
MVYRIGTALAAVALLTATPLFAQTSLGGGLVVVKLSDVGPQIAQDISVDVSQIPVTVQAPTGIAASVCGVDANILAQQQSSGVAVCTARNTSSALDQLVRRRLEWQGSD